LAFRKHSKHKYIIGLRGFYYGLAEGFKTIRHLKKRKQFLTLTFLMWTMYLLQIYVGFSALSETSDLNLIHACSVLTLATLAMIVSPGGMGAFPLAVQQILLLYNHDNISFGWLMWGVSTAIVVVGGLISFVLLLYKNKPYYEAKPTGLQ
jgi:glycosyltransferase 2 family protein